jgi:hypothetical protein
MPISHSTTPGAFLSAAFLLVAGRRFRPPEIKIEAANARGDIDRGSRESLKKNALFLGNRREKANVSKGCAFSSSIDF